MNFLRLSGETMETGRIDLAIQNQNSSRCSFARLSFFGVCQIMVGRKEY